MFLLFADNIIFFFYSFFNWSIIALQCCVSFRWPMKWISYVWVLTCFSRAWLFVTPRSAALLAQLSMGFSKREYWSRLHALLQGIFPTQGSNPHLLPLLHWQVGFLPLALSGNQLHVYIDPLPLETSSHPSPLSHYLNTKRSSLWYTGRSHQLSNTRQGTGEPGGLPSMGSHMVGHDWSDLAAAAAAAAVYLWQTI